MFELFLVLTVVGLSLVQFSCVASYAMVGTYFGLTVERISVGSLKLFGFQFRAIDISVGLLPLNAAVHFHGEDEIVLGQDPDVNKSLHALGDRPANGQHSAERHCGLSWE